MKKRRGFTLVELVVVIMILGVLSAVAVPRLFSTTKSATDGAMRQTVSSLRGAIERYAADHNGQLPGSDASATTFKSDLVPYLRPGQPFPKCSVGAKNADIRIETAGTVLTGDASPTQGWAYDNKSGQFIVNSSAVSNDGTTLYHDF